MEKRIQKWRVDKNEEGRKERVNKMRTSWYGQMERMGGRKVI